MSTSTVQAQAPTALLALVHHIRDTSLGVPHSIRMPAPREPWFSVSVSSHDLDGWLNAGFIVDTVDSLPLVGRIAGRRAERVQYDGRLEALGIRIRIVAVRPIHDLHVASDAHEQEVTA